MKLLNSSKDTFLYASWIATPIGSMIAVASSTTLFLLEFSDNSQDQEISRLEKVFSCQISFEKTPLLSFLAQELKKYFSGNLKLFSTSINPQGTIFQKKVWNELNTIPFGQTRSYLEIAQNLENPKGMRAVGLANGANPIAIIVPCHRVILANGQLGGYRANTSRKKWLLNHENTYTESKVFGT